jgi:uncharacterized protein YqgC (DUF456 family)
VEARGVDSPALLWIAVAALVVVGVVGTVLPGLPGVPLVLAGLVLGAWIDDFEFVGRGTLMTLAVFAVAASGIDFAASALGAKRAGAHRRAVIGAALGALAGLFLGLPGIVLGPFAGAVIGELSVRRSLDRAARVGVATWIGMVLGGAVKLALALSMVALFAYQRFAG